MTDEPEFILNEGIRLHCAEMKQLKGAEGVVPERFAQAQQVRHCALSLVGEPIMYPKINELMRLMHERKISTFLVTNAQFPEAMEALQPVTQLYVSVDAPTPASLKRVDRPLFADYWERFIRCLELIKSKRQRTVYRLTLVKGFNMDEIAEYVNLVRLGMPTFIEIKGQSIFRVLFFPPHSFLCNRAIGVTFCGNTSGSSPLTIQNSPFHEEVRLFGAAMCQQLHAAGLEYDLACEHVHSCCILISDRKMFRNGRWHTHIDFDKFNELVMRYYATGEQFETTDYMAPTPDWAVWGAAEGGFSPVDKRVKPRGKLTERPVPAHIAELSRQIDIDRAANSSNSSVSSSSA